MEENYIEPAIENNVSLQEDQPKMKLWKALNSKQYYSKDYSEFEKQFSSPEKIQKLYDVLNKKQYYTKSYDDFNRQYFQGQDLKSKEAVKAMDRPVGKNDIFVNDHIIKPDNILQKGAPTKTEVVPSVPTGENSEKVIHEAEVSDPMSVGPSVSKAPEDFKENWGNGEGGIRFYKPTPEQVAEFGGIDRLKSNFSVNYPSARLLGQDGKVLVDASESNPANSEPSFGERMGNAVMSLVPSLQNSVFSIPEFIYNFPATFGNLLAAAVENNAGQNEYSDQFKTSGNPYQEMIGMTTSDKDTNWNYLNPFYSIDAFAKNGKEVADYYNNKLKFKNEGIYGSLKAGDYSEAGEQLAVGIVHAVPYVVQMMATEGLSSAQGLGVMSKAAVSAVPFMNMHYQELKDREDLSYNQKMSMAAIAGFTDYTLGSALGTQKLVRETLFKSMTKEEIANMSSGFVNKLLYSNGIAPATMRGGITMATNTMANNITKGDDPMKGVVDSFILGSTMDFGMAAAPKIGSYFRDKSAARKLEVLDSEINNLKRDLEQPDLNSDVTDIIQQKLEEKTKEKSDLIDDNIIEVTSFSKEKRDKIDALAQRLEDIYAIIEHPDADKMYSETSIQAYKEEINKLEKERQQIIDSPEELKKPTISENKENSITKFEEIKSVDRLPEELASKVRNLEDQIDTYGKKLKSFWSKGSEKENLNKKIALAKEEISNIYQNENYKIAPFSAVANKENTPFRIDGTRNGSEFMEGNPKLPEVDSRGNLFGNIKAKDNEGAVKEFRGTQENPSSPGYYVYNHKGKDYLVAVLPGIDNSRRAGQVDVVIEMTNNIDRNKLDAIFDIPIEVGQKITSDLSKEFGQAVFEAVGKSPDQNIGIGESTDLNTNVKGNLEKQQNYSKEDALIMPRDKSERIKALEKEIESNNKKSKSWFTRNDEKSILKNKNKLAQEEISSIKSEYEYQAAPFTEVATKENTAFRVSVTENRGLETVDSNSESVPEYDSVSSTNGMLKAKIGNEVRELHGYQEDPTSPGYYTTTKNGKNYLNAVLPVYDAANRKGAVEVTIEIGPNIDRVKFDNILDIPIEVGQKGSAELANKFADAVFDVISKRPDNNNEIITDVPGQKVNNKKLNDNLNEADEWDALMAGGAEKFRTDGKKTLNGVEYVRQEPIAEVPVGKSDQVKFADGVDVPFDYVLVDASKLQPAHSNGVRNNSHFIPEAQPKNRKDAASLKSSDEMAAKINVRELGENTNAYSGAPIINERGEVIQGNNRSDAIRKHYESGRDKYKNALANAAEQFGLTKEQVEGMERPVLVRRVKASDSDAITLGNYEFKDIESGGSARINPVNVSRRMPRADKARLVDAVFGGNTEMTINEAMRANGKKVVEVLKPYLSDTQKASLFKQNGEFRPEAVKDMEGLVTNFLFEGADVSISDAYDALPSRTQQGINRSLPKLLSLPAAKTIIPELQRAIGIVAQYKKSGVESFESWANQADMFAGGKSPKTQFGEVEMLLAKLLSEAKTPKNIFNALGKYANKVSPNEGDMFTPKTDGESKDSGLKDLKENVNEETRKPIEQASTAPGSDSGSRGGRNGRKEEGGADLFTDGSGDSGRVEPSGIYEQSQGSIVQDRKNNLTNERIKPEVTATTDKPRKLNEISGDLVEGLNATVLHGKGGRRGVLGSYRSSDTLVKISKAGDVDTMAHEVGHLLDDRYDVFGKIPAADRSKIYNELQWFADRGGSNPSGRMSDAQKIEYLKREGIAEYFRAKIANPKEAANRAPLFDQHFEKMVYGDAEVKKVLDNFSKEYINLANSSNAELMSANIENSALPDKKGFKEWLEKSFPTKKEGVFQINAFDRLKVNFTNSMAIANKAFRFAVNELGDGKALPIHKQFDIVARNFAGEGGKINWLMERGLHDADNKLIKGSDGKAMNVEWLIKDLDSSSPEALHGEMDDVIRLLIAERTVEYSNKFERDNNLSGIGAGLKKDLDVASGHLMDFEKLKGADKEKYERIRKAADKYREYADATLRYAVDKGRISEADYQAISDNNQFYVSMKRIKESSPLEEQLGYISKSGGSLGSVREVLHTAKGGSDMISNPYQSLLMNMANIVREADRNEVVSTFIEPLTKKRSMGDGDAVNYAQIAHEVNSQSGLDRIIEYYDKGEKKRWRIADKDVFSALKNLEGISDGPIWKALAFPAKVIRSTVTNFPVFAARNATRDTIARLIHSRTNSGLKDFLGTKPYEDAFHLYGGSQAGFHLIDKLDYSRKLSDTVKEITKKGGIVLDPRKIWSGYKAFLEKSENVNRMAEFKSAYQKAIKEGMSERDAGLYAAYQARDLMDFAVAGDFIRKINQIIPFTNAAVQGLVRTAKIAKEQPGGFALRMALYTIVPTLITRSMVIMMGDDKEYKQLPDYQRDLFWNFKVPGIESWFSIPKPFELGLASSFVDRSMDMTTGSEAKDAYSGLGHAGFDAMIPFDRNSLMGSARPLIEAMTNKDTFRDTYIVPQYEEGKDMELRKGANKASRLGKALSSAFSLVDDVDPRKVDHVIKGYTTYVGDWAMTLSDIGRDDSRNKFGVSKTGFMKETPISGSKSVSEFFKVAKRKGKERSREVKYIHSLIQDYYDAQSEVKRRKIAETIWRESDKYRKVFEALKNSD